MNWFALTIMTVWACVTICFWLHPETVKKWREIPNLSIYHLGPFEAAFATTCMLGFGYFILKVIEIIIQ